MSFTTEKHDHENCVVITLKGRILEAESIEAVIAMVQNDLDAGSRCFIMDMAGVELLNSTGIGMLVRTVKAVNQSGGKVVFSGVPPKIQELLQIIKLNAVMDIASNVQEATQILAKSAQ